MTIEKSSSLQIKPVKKAVFPVAGLGTRFLPATKAIPKEMLPVIDRPLLQYAIEEAKQAGVEDFVFVTGRGKRAIEDHFDTDHELNNTLKEQHKVYALDAVRQTEIPAGRLFYTRQPQALGLGHAVWCAREFVGEEPFAVLLPDDFILAAQPCLSQMIESYQKVGGNLVAVMDIAQEQSQHYGMIDIKNDDGTLIEINNVIEKPSPEETPSCCAIIGRYILQPQIFTFLERAERGKAQEIQLTDGMAKLIPHQQFYGYRFQGIRYDCGSKIGYLEASIAYACHHTDAFPQIHSILKKYV